MNPDESSSRLDAIAETAALPGPELKKLDYFVGKWLVAGTISPGPWGQGGLFSWTEDTQWMTGNFFLVGHWNFKMPAELGGDGEELFVIGYDTVRKVYTFDAFSSQGRHQVSDGATSRNAWTWTSQAVFNDQTLSQKMTITVQSPASYNLKFEVSEDGQTWKTFMEGKAAKQ